VSIPQNEAIKTQIQTLWPTYVLHINLLEKGLVSTSLHEWLDRYAEENHEALTGKMDRLKSQENLYQRYDLSVFQSPKTDELKQIRQTIIDISDEFVRNTIVDPIPPHVKKTLMWFVIQHPNRDIESVSPHYHEGSDIAFAYYLSVPNNQSGRMVMLDPRGTMNRGGLVLPRHRLFADICPKRGDLIMFHRHLVHYSTLNTDLHNRKVIGGGVCYDRKE
jgi:hypothetical protein